MHEDDHNLALVIEQNVRRLEVEVPAVIVAGRVDVLWYVAAVAQLVDGNGASGQSMKLASSWFGQRVRVGRGRIVRRLELVLTRSEFAFLHAKHDVEGHAGRVGDVDHSSSLDEVADLARAGNFGRVLQIRFTSGFEKYPEKLWFRSLFGDVYHRVDAVTSVINGLGAIVFVLERLHHPKVIQIFVCLFEVWVTVLDTNRAQELDSQRIGRFPWALLGTHSKFVI